MKKYVQIGGILAIAVASFATGLLVNNKIGPAALSVPFLNNTPALTRTCVDQKCVAVTNQCSADVNCATHTQCNNLKKCVSVSGAGTNKCSADKDCNPLTDPQKWCEANNTGIGAFRTVAIKYPNGNFTCDCFYLNKDGTRAQTPCRNYHLQ